MISKTGISDQRPLGIEKPPLGAAFSYSAESIPRKCFALQKDKGLVFLNYKLRDFKHLDVCCGQVLAVSTAIMSGKGGPSGPPFVHDRRSPTRLAIDIVAE